MGHPKNILTCAEFGYNLFDSTMPTRDARHGRLYTFTVDPTSSVLTGDWFGYLYTKDKKHIKKQRPISEYCECFTCRHFSLGYVHHLFKLMIPFTRAWLQFTI